MKVEEARQHAFRHEKKTHMRLLGLLLVFAILLSLYEFSTGALRLTTFAIFFLFIMFAGLIAERIHKGNIKKLLSLPFILALVVLFSFSSVPSANAYTFSGGSITSSNGQITSPIPYVTPPTINFANTNIIGSIPPISTPSFTSNAVGWFEAIVINLLIDLANAFIYVINIILGFIISIVAAVISIPLYLIDAISITTLGPVIDFLSFIPASYAWVATAAVWTIALSEWAVIIIVIVRITRLAVGGFSQVIGTEEEGLKEDVADLE